jgi:hypothetical protein
MSSVASLYGDTDMARIMYGQNARHVPAWMYVQNQGGGTVGLVGSSRTPQDAHPLRYGSGRVHQLIVGEIIVRPHLVIATDTYQGCGVSQLYMNSELDFDAALARGEVVLGSSETLRRVRQQWEG